jgi:hypothetical protein
MKDGCEKCGKELPYWMERMGASKFVGGVVAVLCTTCTSEIDRAVQAHAAFARLQDAQVEMAICAELARAGKDTTARAVGLQAKVRTAQLELHDHARGLIPGTQTAQTE